MDIDSASGGFDREGNMPLPDSLPEGQQFSITALSQLYGITPRSLRFYEDHGLLSPERRGQTRIYSRSDAARLGWVLRGKRVGFSLAEIRELLDLYDQQDGRTRQRLKTIEKCRERAAALEAQRHDLDQMIEELNGFCSQLEGLVTRSRTTA